MVKTCVGFQAKNVCGHAVSAECFHRYAVQLPKGPPFEGKAVEKDELVQRRFCSATDVPVDGRLTNIEQEVKPSKEKRNIPSFEFD